MNSALAGSNAADSLRQLDANAHQQADAIQQANEMHKARGARRLDRIASSISSFLMNQVERLERELDRCQKAVDNEQIVQQLMADFEQQKSDWELNRQIEIERLNAAGEKLVAGWEKLETERRDWLENRGKKN